MRVLVILFLFSIVAVFSGKHRSVSGSRRAKIIGGNDARPRSHPYLVSLHMTLLWTNLRICSGSLLSDKWILTAGHCLKGNWLSNWLPMEALVGTNDLVEKASTAQTVSIADRHVHPYYRGPLGAYDIAMLKTAKDIEFNSAVYPITLPFTMGSYRQYVNNLVLAGWGALDTTVFMPAYHNKLQEAMVMQMPFKACNDILKELKNALHGYESSPVSMAANICSAGHRGKAACSGDSGAPLIQYVAQGERESTSTLSTPEEIESWPEGNTNEIDSTTNNYIHSDETTTAGNNPVENVLSAADLVQQYIDEGLTPVVIGVVSWGPCGLVGAPTVYNNVSMYADFIEQHLFN